MLEKCKGEKKIDFNIAQKNDFLCYPDTNHIVMTGTIR